MKITPTLLVAAALILSLHTPRAQAADALQVTQYGITWTFDTPRPVGQYITGDWWVVGPVKVVSVSPNPGPADAGETNPEVKSIYGAAAMQDDNRMRNGSMIVEKPSGQQGYDSRLKNYSAELTVSFPLALAPGKSLISTASNTEFPTPVLLEAIMWATEKKGTPALRSAAILTCVDKAPAADAFRPAYAGTGNKSFQASQIKWDLLPALRAPAEVPDWTQFERYFERPWLDHVESWLLQHQGPVENQANYGREFSRVTSIASLMVMLDVPREQKTKLTHGLIQMGIDFHGLAQAGRQWNADGGHWNGRKWPILFAGLMLDQPDFIATAGGTKTHFSEDQQTYYGKGWAGQTALYQIVTHTGPKQPYEEKAPKDWDAHDKRSEGYRIVVSGGLPGTALAAQLMGAKARWNHNAFFDYYDRWMATDDPYATGRGGVPRPRQEAKAVDAFVTEMWKLHRSEVPSQADGKDDLKWIWESGRNGKFIPNPKP